MKVCDKHVCHSWNLFLPEEIIVKLHVAPNRLDYDHALNILTLYEHNLIPLTYNLLRIRDHTKYFIALIRIIKQMYLWP